MARSPARVARVAKVGSMEGEERRGRRERQERGASNPRLKTCRHRSSKWPTRSTRLTERRRSRQKVCCNCMRLNSSHGSKWRVCLEVDHRHFDTPPQPRCTVEKTFEWSPTSPIQTGRRGENGTKLNGNAMKEMRERRLYSAIYTSNISARTAVQYFVLHE